MNENQRAILHEYYFRRLAELDDRENEIIVQIRQKRCLYILCDELRLISIEKQVILRMYEELRLLIWQGICFPVEWEKVLISLNKTMCKLSRKV